MSDLLSLPDIKTIEPPQKNETDMTLKQSDHLNVVLNVVLTSCTNTVQEIN